MKRSFQLNISGRQFAPTWRRFWAIGLLGLASCGGSGGGNGSVETAVVDIEVADRSVALRSDSTVSLLFTYDLALLDDDDATFYLVVHLPPQLDYRINSSRLLETAGRKLVQPNEIDCESGESFVVYALGNELVSRSEDPEGDARSEVQFTVRAVEESDSRVSIRAFATTEPPDIQCDKDFESDQELLLSIVTDT
ncbi:MAG: hypothetical protein IT290_13065 [Deltaproteobacteria bacterium]|nr:hypothetical protein [Deltaproteobacteria bacterium]